MFKEESQLGRIEIIYRRKGNVTRVGKLLKRALLLCYVYDSVLVIQSLILLLRNQKDFIVQNVVYDLLFSVCSGIDL